MAPRKPYPISDVLDRELAAWLFNLAWELLDVDPRTAEQDVRT